MGSIGWIVIGVAAGLVLLATVIVMRTHSSSSTASLPARAVASLLAGGVLIGMATNAATYFLLKGIDTPADAISMDRLSPTTVGGKPFTVSGTAKVSGDHSIWLLVHRSGGFDVFNQAPVSTGSDGRWTLTGVVVGRSPEKGKSKSPDSGGVYTISAVVVDGEGTKAIEQAVKNAAGLDEVFIALPEPAGLITQSSAQVTVSR